MKRATTPKHTFSFNVDPNESFEKILIIYAQNGRVVLEKHKEDLTFEEPIVCDDCGTFEWPAWLRLTQEETNMFTVQPLAPGSIPDKNDKRSQVTVQVRVLSVDGEALASDKKTISLYDVLDDQVLMPENDGQDNDNTEQTDTEPSG